MESDSYLQIPTTLINFSFGLRFGLILIASRLRKCKLSDRALFKVFCRNIKSKTWIQNLRTIKLISDVYNDTEDIEILLSITDPLE